MKFQILVRYTQCWAAIPTELMLPKANIREQEPQGSGQSQIPALNPVPTLQGLAHTVHWHHHDFTQGQSAKFFGKPQHRKGKYCNSALAWMKYSRQYSNVLLKHDLNPARLGADLTVCSTQGEPDTQKGQAFLIVVYLATKSLGFGFFVWVFFNFPLELSYFIANYHYHCISEEVAYD